MLQLIRIFDDSIESKATPIVNTDDWNAISRGWSGGLNKYKFNITQISKAEALGIFKIKLSKTFKDRTNIYWKITTRELVWSLLIILIYKALNSNLSKIFTL